MWERLSAAMIYDFWPSGRVPFFCAANRKGRKKRPPGVPRISCASRLCYGAPPTAHPYAEGGGAASCRAPPGARSKPCNAWARHNGIWIGSLQVWLIRRCAYDRVSGAGFFSPSIAPSTDCRARRQVRRGAPWTARGDPRDREGPWVTRRDPGCAQGTP